MRLRVTAVAALMVATLIGGASAPVLGWHGITEDCNIYQKLTPKARVIGPAGDPFYRVVVKVKSTYSTCIGGSITHPENRWTQSPDDWWLLVFDSDGDRKYTIPHGETVGHVRPDTYTGKWYNHVTKRTLTETEDLRVSANVVRNFGRVKVTWRYVGRDGVRRVTKTLREGCTWRSGWHWVKGGTRMWVQDNDHGKRLLARRAAPPGYYGPLYKGYERGTTCGIILAG